MNTNKENKEKLYKNIETDGITENVAGEQTIQTENTKILKGEKGKKDKEILIGKKIEDVEKVEEDFNSVQRKMLNKFM
ncbi:hypothetical protein [Polaribacter porphyrae]|uniref:Uncharacterized protein n=1 Tax=Polaribacter porphyrae TaxID=1137780 RepID=A0A2S7WKG5_9FLAO|nr:hypothetical protein [Polaribacter porphyrae]PQJ78094.1 hypothetical protein BTO18_02300 [Polaribacter porphyrae]